jgi:hypothetical protein
MIGESQSTLVIVISGGILFTSANLQQIGSHV